MPFRDRVPPQRLPVKVLWAVDFVSEIVAGTSVAVVRKGVEVTGGPEAPWPVATARLYTEPRTRS